MTVFFKFKKNADSYIVKFQKGFDPIVKDIASQSLSRIYYDKGFLRANERF